MKSQAKKEPVGKKGSKESGRKPLNKGLKKAGEKLRQIRAERKYTSAESYANDYNVDRTLYGRYERGENMTLSSLLNMLEKLEISVADFFKDFD